jgi:hypothetical protein
MQDQWSPGVIVAIALVFFGLAIGAVGTLLFSTRMSDIVNDGALAAWVQAGSAAIALGIAIFVPYRLDERARTRAENERRMKARVISKAIFPELLEARAALDGAMARWRGARGGIAGAGSVARLAVFRMRVPPSLEGAFDQLYVLGEPAGPTLMQLKSVMAQYNRMIDELERRVSSDQEVVLEHAAEAISGHLSALEALIQSAKAEITPVHDGES